VEWVRIRSVKHTERAFVIKSETEKVIEVLIKLKQKAYILDEFGHSYTTKQFSEKMLQQRNAGNEIIFVV
jgi:23S rRNA pseudoU1915 N3-methylase RlmH